MSAENSIFSVRILVCDHYLCKPLPGIDVIYSEFRGSDIKQVPVLRIFGPTPDGYKCCIHIHGVFPYFYLPCPMTNPEPQFLYQLSASLDKALNIALKQAMSANQHVYKISLVKGLPFYGYHDKEHLYLKVFLYNPGLIKQAVELCSSGAILGQPFQPHESHLNFTLQFFIDFNLFGMSNIDLGCVKHRKKPGMSQSSTDLLDSLEENNLKPESMCYYEVDCSASHIINRQRIGKGDGIENPGLEEVWNQEKKRRKELNMSLASKSLSQGRLRADETDSHYKFEQMFLMKMSNLIDAPAEVKVNDNIVHYPAESLEGSQLFQAVDVSIHLPDSASSGAFNETLTAVDYTEDFDNTLVDENVVLNSSLSLHYSQIQLDNEDLDLVDMLQDLDEDKTVETDSIMGTPAEEDDATDLEYSQIFDEKTLILEQCERSKDTDNDQTSWNDSFWDDANIPQIDGTFDDDHVKKVRKRKMRPLQIGLSRPKSKKKVEVKVKTEPVSEININDSTDEINESRETMNNISDIQIKKTVKSEPVTEVVDHDVVQENTDIDRSSITTLVDKMSVKKEKSFNYDIEHNFEPEPGPSCLNTSTKNKSNCDIENNSFNDSSESSPDLGFISFYDTSKLFDVTVNEHQNEKDAYELLSEGVSDIDTKRSNKISLCNEITPSEDIKLHYSVTPLISNKININKNCILTPKFRAPSRSYVLSTLEKYNIPKVNNKQPYYSDHKDVGDKIEIGNMVIKLQSNYTIDQKPFDKCVDSTSIEEWRQLMFLQANETSEVCAKPELLKSILAGNKPCVLQTLKKPPLKSEIVEWIKNKEIMTKKTKEDDISQRYENTEISHVIDELDSSQVIGLNELNNSISPEIEEKENTSLDNSLQVSMHSDGSFLCFGSGQTAKEVTDSPAVEVNNLTIMILEVHTAVRRDLNPDPTLDEIHAAFVSITNDSQNEQFPQKSIEIIVVDDMLPPKKLGRCVTNQKIIYVDKECELIQKVIDLIKKHDPDIMCGYEMEMNSWGYYLERSQVLGFEIVLEISRITEKHRQKRWRSGENDFEGRIIGRILFNVWRLFRYELALSSYSFENCMFEVLKERVPSYSFAQLGEWWNNESRIMRWIPVEHYLTRLSGTIRMLEKLDIINRTAELARLFGLQWWEVLSRGSQFRVESLMFRSARPLNLIALSPTVKQRAAMKAPECLPLIFEPESRFYSDPVIVLDFQSLYPSMMIAYNYCFSTCIGRVQHINGETSYEFGAWRLRIPKSKLELLVQSGLVHWSPVGVGFVKASVRRGVLPAMLRRILAARQAVKKSMKQQTDEDVKKAMHSRQLGLKLIANVTYGYTAANFSGRMPCVEVGDSVVAKGRETLERAIKLVENNKEWNAKVVYGDTDSMFVVVPGGTKKEAFEIGQQIADAVTADNPSPVALKLEKVYQPCILQTKKRYVGYMFESPEQASPVYEAKGIETVRRDGCPAGVKLLQRCLCDLFETGDMSRVKKRVTSLLSQVVDGTLPPQELFFTREYHGPAGYRPGAAAPPNEIAKRLVLKDRRALPRTGQRLHWLVTAGAPGLPLVKLARTPQELLRDPGLTPHVEYYVTRVLLPPLHRCLSLLGVNVFKWYSSLTHARPSLVTGGGGGLARYLWRSRCVRCGVRAGRSLCGACGAGRGGGLVQLRLGAAERGVGVGREICRSCCGHQYEHQCQNTECPVIWRRVTAQHKLTQVKDIIRQLPEQLKCNRTFDF